MNDLGLSLPPADVRALILALTALLGVGYLVLLWAANRVLGARMRIRCPETGTPATVTFQLDREGHPSRVVRCSRLRHGALCHHGCLGEGCLGEARAA
jgi:hypothetical protein